MARRNGLLLGPYPTIVAAQVRSQVAYRTSFVTNVMAAFGLGLLEFAEIYVLLTASPVLGGLSFGQAALVFALANLGFALGDMVCGQLDQVPTYIRAGQLDSFLLRPLRLLPQLLSSSFELRRLGRAAFGLVTLVVSLSVLPLSWTPATIYLLVITPLVGGAIYGALFVLAGGLQFWLVDGTEFTNGFVYGSSYAGQVPGSVLLAPAKVFFTFVVPATAAAYLPALLILGLPGGGLLPAWLGWLAPALALWVWLLAGLAWRAGTRKYNGAGG